MERQKQALRDYIAQAQPAFECVFTELLLAQPDDPRGFLIEVCGLT